MGNGTDQRNGNTVQETPAQKWWNSLQAALDRDGCGLKLSDPEDAAFLSVLSYREDEDEDYSVTEHFALDPRRQSVDIAEITPEEIVARQQTANVSDETKEYLYEQAKHGLLFLRGNTAGENKHGTCQILIGDDGKAVVGNDFEHPSPEERLVVRNLTAPEKPSEPGADVREKAAAGDKMAQNRLKAYESDLEKYQALEAEWDQCQEYARSHPEKYEIAKNHAIAVGNYFQATMVYQTAIRMYMEKLGDLHKQAAFRRLPDDVRELEINRDRQGALFLEGMTDVAGLWNNGARPQNSVYTGSFRNALAKLFFGKQELLRGEAAAAEGKGAEFRALGGDETETALAAYRESDEFRLIMDTVIREGFGSVFGRGREEVDPGTKAEELYENVRQKIADGKQKWWNGLQKTLDDAGYELDLNTPEDLARLKIFDVEHPGRGVFSAVPHYAADPEYRAVDVGTISEREILARQKPGVPDDQTFFRMQQAAREGRLFVQGHENAKKPVEPCPVLLDKDGGPVVKDNGGRLSEEEAPIAELFEEPVRPEAPGLWTKFLALFRNRNALNTIAEYERKLQIYNTNREKWDAIQQKDPALVKRVQNSLLIEETFFQSIDTGVQRTLYSERLTKLHEKAEAGKLPDEKRTVRQDVLRHREEIMQIIDTTFTREQKAGVIRADEPLSEQNAFLLARILVARSEIIRGNDALLTGKESGYRPKTEAELEQAQEELFGSDPFKRLCTNLKGAALTHLSAMAENYGERNTMRHLDQLCADVMNNENQPEAEDNAAARTAAEEVNLDAVPVAGGQ